MFVRAVTDSGGISLEHGGWLYEKEDDQERVLAPVPKRGDN